MGVSPAAFAPKGRRQTKGSKAGIQLSKHMTNKGRGLAQNAIVSTVYQARYCNITNEAARFDMQPSDIEVILKKCGDQYFDEVSRSAAADLPVYKCLAVAPLVVTPNGLLNPGTFVPSLSSIELRSAKKDGLQKWSRSHKFTPVQLLRALRQALLGEELELGWDYLRMHRMCWTFFRGLREALTPDLTKLYGKDFIGHERFLPCITFPIFQTASDDKLDVEFQKTHNVKPSNTHLLEKTAEVMNDFIRRGQGAVCVEKMASGCGLQSKIIKVPVGTDLVDFSRRFNALEHHADLILASSQESNLIKNRALNLMSIAIDVQQFEDEELLGNYRDLHRVKRRLCKRYVHEIPTCGRAKLN